MGHGEHFEHSEHDVHTDRSIDRTHFNFIKIKTCYTPKLETANLVTRQKMAVKWRMLKFYLIKIKWGTWHDVNADRRIDGTHFHLKAAVHRSPLASKIAVHMSGLLLALFIFTKV